MWYKIEATENIDFSPLVLSPLWQFYGSDMQVTVEVPLVTALIIIGVITGIVSGVVNYITIKACVLPEESQNPPVVQPAI